MGLRHLVSSLNRRWWHADMKESWVRNDVNLLTEALHVEDPLGICRTPFGAPTDEYEPEALCFLMLACGAEPFQHHDTHREEICRPEVKRFLLAPPVPEAWRSGPTRDVTGVLDQVFKVMFGLCDSGPIRFPPTLTEIAQRSWDSVREMSAQAYGSWRDLTADGCAAATIEKTQRCNATNPSTTPAVPPERPYTTTLQLTASDECV